MTETRSDNAIAPAPSSHKFKRVFSLSLLLIAGWLLWSGLYSPLLLSLGALSCVLTLYVVARMGYFDNETFAFNYGWRLLGFWTWLGKEIVASSIVVSKVILRRNIHVEPQIVEIDASDLDLVDQAVLGNSISLTPGSLTLDVHEGRLLVHAITPEVADELKQGEMLDRVRSLR